MRPATEPLREPLRSRAQIAGGEGAPQRARTVVRDRLESTVPARHASDAALIVSELVTNSVVHAHVTEDQFVWVELTTVGDHLRIAVIDPGSELEPRLGRQDPNASRGFGLRLVEQISSAWGVCRQTAGETRVWCELRLDVGRVPSPG
jgi:anti-sigma regulatory factor (Ser/Thr protein kinase)